MLVFVAGKDFAKEYALDQDSSTVASK